MNKQPQKSRSFLAHHFPSITEKISESNLADFQEFSIWQAVCDELLEKPFPSHSSNLDFSTEDTERDSQVTFAKLSHWEIICQEILDTEYSHVYYQRCYDELRKRGKSEQEVFELRRCAWYTAGWLNFPMMLWNWVSLEESDILKAIELLYERKQISQEQRVEFEDFVNFMRKTDLSCNSNRSFQTESAPNKAAADSCHERNSIAHIRKLL